MITAGVDEAGRGALAGPVVAGAVIIDEDKKSDDIIESIRDSKVMTDIQRRECYAWICEHCDFGVGIVLADEIDKVGIKKATEKAMNQAVSNLNTTPKQLKVDGRDKFQFSIDSEDIIGGDGKVLEISAASIVAKVVRDDIMIDLDHKYPRFGFAQSKGYGAAQHLKLVAQGEYCQEHRQTYEPLKTFLSQHRLF